MMLKKIIIMFSVLLAKIRAVTDHSETFMAQGHERQ